MLPENFKLDQIVSEINIFPVSLSLNLPILNFKKLVLVGDSFHTFHPVGGQGLNTCWRDVNSIYDIFYKDLALETNVLRFFKYKYYLKRIIDVISTIIITDSLITIFANRITVFIPIRKISFLLLNNFLFVRKIILNYMTKSLVFLSIK